MIYIKKIILPKVFVTSKSKLYLNLEAKERTRYIKTVNNTVHLHAILKMMNNVKDSVAIWLRLILTLIF